MSDTTWIVDESKTVTFSIFDLNVDVLFVFVCVVGFGITPSPYAMTVMNVLPTACLQSGERMMSDGWMLRHQGGDTPRDNAGG